MRLLIILTVAALAGCQTCPPPAPPRIIDTACSWLSQMTASTNDTPATKREIIAYDIARQKNCPASSQ